MGVLYGKWKVVCRYITRFSTLSLHHTGSRPTVRPGGPKWYSIWECSKKKTHFTITGRHQLKSFNIKGSDLNLWWFISEYRDKSAIPKFWEKERDAEHKFYTVRLVPMICVQAQIIPNEQILDYLPEGEIYAWRSKRIQCKCSINRYM